MANNLSFFSISGICSQSKKKQLFNIPPSRLETISPYGGIYSQNDLNMRRKAEIFKYAGNKTNTKTNNLTKKQTWALITTGNYRPILPNQLKNTIPITNTISVLNNCNTLIRTPSTSSDVPGPAIMLYDDETVPLYNYISISNRSYSQQNPEFNNTWDSKLYPNVKLNNTDTIIGSIYFIEMPYYSYNMNLSLSKTTDISYSNITVTGNIYYDSIKVASLPNGTITQIGNDNNIGIITFTNILLPHTQSNASAVYDIGISVQFISSITTTINIYCNTSLNSSSIVASSSL
jgi:hypothetical protein